ncbi:hypothetical protein EJ02DRAFT_240034 [Clathrospora elynae]|uniref:Uncharacterized protein n=1 Tax=Clathrospora elynae TaxID=706981 RepID=A0A6A5SSL2_9PLEO|nr:hypothetical protein EJ02DRAFT_240034 [Clathrospora elynae]
MQAVGGVGTWILYRNIGSKRPKLSARASLPHRPSSRLATVLALASRSRPSRNALQSSSLFVASSGTAVSALHCCSYCTVRSISAQPPSLSLKPSLADKATSLLSLPAQLAPPTRPGSDTAPPQPVCSR